MSLLIGDMIMEIDVDEGLKKATFRQMNRVAVLLQRAKTYCAGAVLIDQLQWE